MAQTKKAGQGKGAGKTAAKGTGKAEQTKDAAQEQDQDAVQEQAQNTAQEQDQDAAQEQEQDTAQEQEQDTAQEQTQDAAQEQEQDTAQEQEQDAAQEPDMFANLPNPCVYCGPSIKGITRQNTTYQGGIPDALRALIQEHPGALGLIVPTGKFQAMRKRLETPGTQEAKLYKAIKAGL